MYGRILLAPTTAAAAPDTFHFISCQISTLLYKIINEALVSIKGMILTGPGSVWFGTVVILTRPVQ